MSILEQSCRVRAREQRENMEPAEYYTPIVLTDNIKP